MNAGRFEIQFRLDNNKKGKVDMYADVKKEALAQVENLPLKFPDSALASITIIQRKNYLPRKQQFTFAGKKFERGATLFELEIKHI